MQVNNNNGQNLNKHFKKENMQMATKHIKNAHHL